MATSSARKQRQIEGIKPSDSPDQVYQKLNVINDIISNLEPETLNKEERKQFLSILDNTTQKELENILASHVEYKALLCCCYLDLIKILTIENELVIKRTEFMFRMIIDLIKHTKTVLEKNFRNQLIYVLHNFEKIKASKIFFTDNLTESGKSFIQELLSHETELTQYPDLFYQTQKLLISIFEVSFTFVSDENLQYIMLPIIICLQKVNSKSKKFELAKSTIKELSWGARTLCGKLCIDLFKKKDIYRKVQLDHENMISIIYYLFKIDYDIIRGIWPYIETEINLVSKKENKKSYFWLISKIISFKGSEVSTNCPQIFNFFVENLALKKNKQFRRELLERAFKYLEHFTYCKKVSDLEISTSTVKYDVFRKNLAKIEGKLKELLYEGEDDIKLYILDMIHKMVITNSQYISQAVILDVANLLWWSKEKNKDRVIILLADIYSHYCGSLYEEDVFDFEDKSGNFQLVNGIIDSTMLQRKEAAKSFQWIGEHIVLYDYQAKKIEFPLLHSALTKILNLQNFDSKNTCKRLIGFFHNIRATKYKDPKLDVNNYKYYDFVQKILKYNWYDDDDLKNSTFNFLYRALYKILENFIKVTKSYREYIIGIVNKDESQKEDAARGLRRYLMNNDAILDIEKELIEKLTDKDLEKCLMIAVDLNSPSSDKKLAMEYINQKLQHPSWTYLINNYCIHPFCPEVYEKIGYFSLIILKKDQEYTPYLREGVIELVNFLMKSDKESRISHQIGDLVNYVSENFSLLINVNPYHENETSIPKDKAELSKKKSFRNLSISHQELAKNCLKLLSKIDLQEFHEQGDISNLEDIKNELGNLMKKSQLSPQQTKFAAKIVVKLDKITSENIASKLCESLIQHLEVRSNFLHSNLRGIIELLKSDKDLFIYHMNSIEEFTKKLIPIPVPMPKYDLIAELTQCKKHMIKLLYKSYYTQELSIINDNYTKNAKKFRATLLDLLMNFQSICPGHMKPDRDYLRIYALTYLLDILARENSQEIDPEFFAKLGLLCYDDNDDFKRVLFSTIINKKNKRNYSLPNILFILALFMNSANDENLRIISIQIFNKEIERYAEDYIDYINKAKKEDIMRSPEYLLVYILFLMANNPILLLNAKTISTHCTKCIDVFTNAVNATTNPNRAEYFMNILHRLEDCEPATFQDLSKTSIEFTDLKVKKTIRKPTFRELQDNQQLSFRETIHLLIHYFKEKYGAKAVHTKRLPVTLPPGYFIQSIGRTLDAPRATPLILLNTKLKSSLLSPVVELPIKRLEFNDNESEVFVIQKAPADDTSDQNNEKLGDEKANNNEKTVDLSVQLKEKTENAEEKRILVPKEQINPKEVNKKKGKKVIVKSKKETKDPIDEDIKNQNEPDDKLGKQEKVSKDEEPEEEIPKKNPKKKLLDQTNDENKQDPPKRVKKSKK